MANSPNGKLNVKSRIPSDGIVSVIFVLSNNNGSVLYYLQLPVSLPQKVFYYFSPPTAQDFQMDSFKARKVILALTFFVINGLLYSIPVYFSLQLVSRFRKSKSIQTEHQPPPFN